MEEIINKFENLNYNEQSYLGSQNIFEEEFDEEFDQEIDSLLNYEYIYKIGNILELIIVNFNNQYYLSYLTLNFYNELNTIFNIFNKYINKYNKEYYSSFVFYNKIETLKNDIKSWNDNTQVPWIDTKISWNIIDLNLVRLAYKIIRNIVFLQNNNN